MKKLSWTDLKTFITGRSSSLHYIEFSNHYHIIALDGPLQFYSEVRKVDPVQEGSDQEDFENNYKDLCNKPMQDLDNTGRSIVRQAATQKGWHYQAHSVQFEVNKLDSVYNKDRDGNDLGFTTMKIYNDQGVELTDQTSADTSGVKTVVTWSPDFDLEVISGNIRQATNESVNSYVYVDAVIPTGLPAPYDTIAIPFTTGGINLNYIGADETLKTDGRASKLVPCSLGAKFEIVVNYEPNVINTENRHKMSVIFEIYKAV